MKSVAEEDINGNKKPRWPGVDMYILALPITDGGFLSVTPLISSFEIEQLHRHLITCRAQLP